MLALDLNGDGKLDLAVTTQGGVNTLLGNGNGTFQSPVFTSFSAVTPFYLAEGDFNGDGKPDLVSANSTDNTVTLLLGKGDGTFQKPATIRVSNFTLSVVAGDFNGDTSPDVAVGINPFFAGVVDVLLNTGCH